jgi:hypothetical protein
VPIYSAKNLYPGVNPHLNSALQRKGGGWEMFHHSYVNNLAISLDAILPSNYYVANEKSLQLTEIGIDRLEDKPTRPDVSIFKLHEQPAGATTQRTFAEPTMTLRLDDLLNDEEDFFTAANIYEFSAGILPGRLVTRIEMLSPANKPPHRYHKEYLVKRSETLQAGVNLVEIDFVHTTRPHRRDLPSYHEGEADAFPYVITVSFPHQDAHSGKTDVYGIGVDDVIPTVLIPLTQGDGVAVDFNAIYHTTYSNQRIFQLLSDYAAEPTQFDRYQPQDRQRIRARMAAIAAEHGGQGEA